MTDRTEQLAILINNVPGTTIPRDVRIVTAIAEEAGEVMGAFNKWCENVPRANWDDFIQELAQLQIVIDLAVLRYGHGQWKKMLDSEYSRQLYRFTQNQSIDLFTGLDQDD